jgi:AcrR family transcriptional regulator
VAAVVGGAAWRDRAVVQGRTTPQARLRSLRTIEGIVRAARDLVLEHGGEGFTTQQLAARSGNSLQTIYRYFPSKDAVLLAVFEDAIERGNAAIDEAVRAIVDPVERLAAIIERCIPETPPPEFPFDPARFHAIEAHLAPLFPAAIEEAQHGFVVMVTECIDEAVRAGRIAPRPDPGEDAVAIAHVVRATYQSIVVSGAFDQSRRRAAHVIAFCLAALGVGHGHR